jgi:hypothetical protein
MVILDKLNNYKRYSAKKLKKVKKRLPDPLKDNKKGSKTHRSRRRKEKTLYSKNRNRNFRSNNELSEIQSSLSYSSLDEVEESPDHSPFINNMSMPMINNHLRIHNLNSNYQPKIK